MFVKEVGAGAGISWEHPHQSFFAVLNPMVAAPALSQELRFPCSQAVWGVQWIPLFSIPQFASMKASESDTHSGTASPSRFLAKEQGSKGTKASLLIITGRNKQHFLQGRTLFWLCHIAPYNQSPKVLVAKLPLLDFADSSFAKHQINVV